ncbi:lysozyme family protein [Burkholderia cenocepacia]|uniref:hypothetical protein n=1 Tax=Burkholderia cenocepacia TaxID=95486 RepID=UPI002AAFAFB5|nr:hypothetical protein [Burkholderia cenocepacia]
MGGTNHIGERGAFLLIMWCAYIALVAPWGIAYAEVSAKRERANIFDSDMFKCSVTAAYEFGVPIDVMLAVAEQEAGGVGERKRNANGTFDVGVMQFNTSYLQDLERFGISPQDVAGPGCYPYRLAAWRIRWHMIRDQGDIWQRIANYHSRNADQNAKYRAAIIRRSARWADRLDGHGGHTASR